MTKNIYVFISLIILFSSQLYAQNVSNIEFINRVADKETATFSDGVAFFLLVLGKSPQSF
jgi:hypothetical protein